MAIRVVGTIDSPDGACLLRVGWINKDAAISFRFNLGERGGVSVELPEPIDEQSMAEMAGWKPGQLLVATIEAVK
jgi:hypothetical protein